MLEVMKSHFLFLDRIKIFLKRDHETVQVKFYNVTFCTHTHFVTDVKHSLSTISFSGVRSFQSQLEYVYNRMYPLL